MLSQKWEHATAATIAETFADVVGQGDPVSAAEGHWMQLTASLAGAQQQQPAGRG